MDAHSKRLLAAAADAMSSGKCEKDVCIALRQTMTRMDATKLIRAIVTNESVTSELASFAHLADRLYVRADNIWRTDPRSESDTKRCRAMLLLFLDIRRLTSQEPTNAAFLTLVAVYLWLSIASETESVPRTRAEDNLKVGCLLAKWAPSTWERM